MDFSGAFENAFCGDGDRFGWLSWLSWLSCGRPGPDAIDPEPVVRDLQQYSLVQRLKVAPLAAALEGSAGCHGSATSIVRGRRLISMHF